MRPMTWRRETTVGEKSESMAEEPIMAGSAVRDCLAWTRKSFLVIADGELRRWISEPRTAAFLLVVRRRAADLGFAQFLKCEGGHFDQQQDGDPT